MERNKVLFFHNQIEVQRVVSNSAQAVVFFGRETNLGIKVVLKQYTGYTFCEIIRELRLFTHIEKERVGKTLPSPYSDTELTAMFERTSAHNGLPTLLGYKINKG